VPKLCNGPTPLLPSGRRSRYAVELLFQTFLKYADGVDGIVCVLLSCLVKAPDDSILGPGFRDDES
jgi:hypothetical protein